MSPIWRGLVLLGAVGGLALTQPDLSQAGEASSLYTSLDLAGCADITPPEAREYGALWRCQGHDGMTVRVAEGDLRFFVSYGPNAAAQTAAGQTLPQFNTLGGGKLEWRIRREGGRWKPFATILRHRWESDGREGSSLIVTKLGKDDACHVAYVEAAGNNKANEQARAFADRDASEFVCKQDRAKNYGADGREKPF